MTSNRAGRPVEAARRREAMTRTKRNPTSSPAKTIDAGLQVDTPKRSGSSVPATLALDPYQRQMVAFLAERLGGATDDVLDFLVTAGLYVLQLDAMAEGRVRDGVEQIYGESTVPKAIMDELVDLECNVQNEVDAFLCRAFRPRMTGDWRGVAAAVEV